MSGGAMVFYFCCYSLLRRSIIPLRCHSPRIDSPKESYGPMEEEGTTEGIQICNHRSLIVDRHSVARGSWLKTCSPFTAPPSSRVVLSLLSGLRFAQHFEGSVHSSALFPSRTFIALGTSLCSALRGLRSQLRPLSYMRGAGPRIGNGSSVDGADIRNQ